ncbi:TPA: hypothetical protein ACPUI6_003062 [Klebsiella pneumoniae]
MFRIIRFDWLLKTVSLISLFVTILSFWIFKTVLSSDLSLLRLLSISSLASIIINFFLLSSKISRLIWGTIRFFKKDIYPDLNGIWVGHIITETNDEFEVRAKIKQALLVTKIEMHGPTVKSVTLEATPTKELDNNKLYYVYKSTPKNPSWSEYIGSTIFDVIESNNALQLSGRYYTDRKSVGRISIKRISLNTDSDISFY